MLASFAAYLREGLRHPPQVTARKAAALLCRTAKARAERRRALRSPAFLGETPAGELRRRLRLDGAPVVPAEAVAPYLDHRFDLLGSGLVQVRHGMDCVGLEGWRYPKGPEIRPDAGGDWLAGRVTGANLAESRRIWSLIEPPYAPIDWQLDFKSGWRWSELTYHRDIRYGDRPGADVKVPWELARLQHLPQLALAHRTAPRPEYVREFRNQALDFIAANPPGFGVDWACAMDVAIRLANILVAFDLFRDAGAAFEAPFTDIVKRSAAEHARHVVENLEWAEAGRGNHYLADLVGLLFAGAYLPRSPEADAWLGFAAAELAAEAAEQFLPDGGSIEASTAYHRLSGELLLFGTALLTGLEDGEAQPLRQPQPPLTVRPPPRPPVGFPPPAALSGTLLRAAGLSRDCTKPTGEIVQWGDNDSGRLFGFSPAPLDHRGFVAGVACLTGDRGLAEWAGPAAEAHLVRAFAKARPVVAAPLPLRRFPEPAPAAEIGPAPADRLFRFAVPPRAIRGLRAAAYPDFGHFALIGEHFFVALRCPDSAGGRGPGHAHDDALAVELEVDGCNLITDPGTFVYTPIPAERNRYREAAAHFVPRASGRASSELSAGLFEIRSLPGSRIVAFGPTGIVGEVFGPGWTIRRSVLIKGGEVVVIDQALAGTLAPLARVELLPAVCLGYGVRSGRPARAF